jgi:magnesium transporter
VDQKDERVDQGDGRVEQEDGRVDQSEGVDALTVRRYFDDGTFRTIPAVIASPERSLQTMNDTPGGFTWIGAVDPPAEQLEALRDDLGLHPLAVEDVISGRQQPKLQWFGEDLFIVLWRLRLTGEHRPIAASELYLFARDGLLITVERSQPGVPPLDVANLLDAALPPLRGNALGALYAVLSAVVEGYLEVGAYFEDELEPLEDQVFDETQEDDAARLYRLRRDVGKVGRAVGTIATSFENNRDKLQDFSQQHPTLIPYVLDLVDDLVGVARLTADQEAAVDGVITTHENSVASQQASDSRTIAAIAALLAIPTVISGLYGMNFTDLPLIQVRLGWIVVVVVIVVLELWAYFTLKRRGWL